MSVGTRTADETASKPDPRDTSVIGWLVFTVESARRAGFAVPQATFDSARSWLSQVTTPSTPGAYAYTPNGPASPAMTAEAMFVQQLLGMYHQRVAYPQNKIVEIESRRGTGTGSGA